ncbi:MAG TPA: hypothetical protein V6C93_35525, partial [Allocoleopsis sp.]
MLGRFADPIEAIVKDAVTVKPSYNGTAIEAFFTPNNLTLDEAKKLSGYAYFNWYQIVAKLPKSVDEENEKLIKEGEEPVFSSRQSPNLPISAPMIDSPLSGWSYWQRRNNFSEFAKEEIFNDNLPFYYDEQEPSIIPLNTILPFGRLNDTRKEQEIGGSPFGSAKTLRFF